MKKSILDACSAFQKCWQDIADLCLIEYSNDVDGYDKVIDYLQKNELFILENEDGIIFLGNGKNK